MLNYSDDEFKRLLIIKSAAIGLKKSRQREDSKWKMQMTIRENEKRKDGQDAIIFFLDSL